jgi:peptidoglycan hydrolase CwlO-like protein|tara:strand:- start:84 stop:308 length:225 start_codon:yes stop_codon:yes gene_type:complete
MAQNVTNELIIEHLKQVQSKLSDMAIEISETRSDIRGLKGHVASMLQSEVSKDGEIAAIKLRIERIENRLELRS